MKESDFADASLELNRHIVNLLDSLSALYGLTEITLDDISEKELLRRALEALMENQDMERCSIFLLDEQDMLYNAAGRDWNDLLLDITQRKDIQPPSSTVRFRLGEGIMGRAAKTGEFEYCRSCADDPQFKSTVPDGNPIQGSLICVPIKTDVQVVGVLNVFHPDTGFFNHWHERLLILFGKMLGRLVMTHRLLTNIGKVVDERTVQLKDTNRLLAQEVAERKSAQAALSDQHQFLQSVIDGTPEPIMVIGHDYRIRLLNKAAQANVPETMQEAPLYCYKVSHHRDTPCDGAEHECPLEKVFVQDEAVNVMHEHYTSEGEPRLIELLASPMHDEQGKVTGIIESARDVTDRVLAESRLREQHAQFKHQAQHDHLTGLPNRMLFHTNLYHILEEAEEDEEIALLFLDLDGFKPINDTYGHSFGDALLKAIAQRLLTNTREQDMVARFAGDEFTVVLRALGQRSQASTVSENIIHALSRPYKIDQTEVTIGVSIGISIYPEDTHDPSTLISYSDIAMYRAKEAGKGTYRYYSE